MIISQLLLIGFTLYWLNTQYKENKDALIKDLVIEYKASYETVLDSMLVQHYIQPILGDTIRRIYAGRANGIFVNDSFRIRGAGDSLQSVRTSNSIVQITLNSSDTSSVFAERNDKELEQEMLLRSVKLIVQHVDDSSMHISSFHGGERVMDSVLFISDLESRIENEALNIDIAWIGDSSIKEGFLKSGQGIIIGDWTDDVPSFYLSRYRPYILSQILPQIIFAFLLVLLTGSAFIIAYMSLRKQTMLNEMRDSFISNMSHELKTPVSTVKVAIEALSNFNLKQDAALADEYLAMAAKEIKRLELLIGKVLDNTIIEQDKSILRLELIDAAEIIKGAVESIKPRIIEADARVVFRPGERVMLEADPMYLQGVIINLLDNSLKYGNGNPEIEIKLETRDKKIYIEVSDNGPGIPEQYIKRIFDKFFRIPTSNIHNVKGYGLGLSFAALIIKLHNGEIGVKNNNTGCTFTIEMPGKID